MRIDDAKVGKKAMRPLAIGDLKLQPRLLLSACPSVAKLAARLSENFAATLPKLGGNSWRISVDGIEDRAAPDIVDFGNWFRTESRAGSMTMFMAFDRPAFSALCEAAFGGSGAETPYELPDRPLSGIEKDVLTLALTRLQQGVAVVLSNVLATPVSWFEASSESIESHDRDNAVAFRFLANLYGYCGEIRLVASGRELKSQLDSAGLSGATVLRLEEQSGDLQRQVFRTNVHLTAGLDTETLSVGEIAALAPGQLVKLRSTMSRPIIVKAEGLPFFSAALTRSGDRLAIRLIAPLD